MPDMIAEGLAWLDAELTAHASTAWTYRREGYSCTVNVTEERQKLRVSDSAGGTYILRPDFAGTFNAAELDFGDGPVDPREGDTVEGIFASGTRKFRVPARNVAGEPGWHFADPQKVRVRIFANHYEGG